MFCSFSGPNFSKYLAVLFSRILYIPILSRYAHGLIMYTLFSTLKSLNCPGLSSHSAGYSSERLEAPAKETAKQPTSIKLQKERRAIMPKLRTELQHSFYWELEEEVTMFSYVTAYQHFAFCFVDGESMKRNAYIS